MGRFDKYVGENNMNTQISPTSKPLSISSRSTVAGQPRRGGISIGDGTATANRRSAPGNETSTDRREMYRQRGTPSEGRFAILLDATGSMESLIDMARQCIGDILHRIREESNVRCLVQVAVYRDYDVPADLFACSELSDDVAHLTNWLARQNAHSGGDCREAIEYALSAILHRGDWHAVLLAGDAPPHTRQELLASGRENCSTAADVARSFRQRGIPLHTFVVGRAPLTVHEFQGLAREGGGCTGFLDGSETMRDMAVMSMLKCISGDVAVRKYGEKYKLSVEAQNFSTLLIERRNTD